MDLEMAMVMAVAVEMRMEMEMTVEMRMEMEMGMWVAVEVGVGMGMEIFINLCLTPIQQGSGMILPVNNTLGRLIWSTFGKISVLKLLYCYNIE